MSMQRSVPAATTALPVFMLAMGLLTLGGRAHASDAPAIVVEDGSMYLDGAASDTDDGVKKAVFVNGLDIVAALEDLKQKQEADAARIVLLVDADKATTKLIKSLRADVDATQKKLALALKDAAAVTEATAGLEACQQSLADTILRAKAPDPAKACARHGAAIASCGEFPALSDGIAQGAGTHPGAVRALSCKQGFALAGPAVSVCHVDGKWSGGAAACAPVTTTTPATTTTAAATTTKTKKIGLVGMSPYGHSTALSSGYAVKFAMDGRCNSYWQSRQGLSHTTNQWVSFRTTATDSNQPLISRFGIYPMDSKQAPGKCRLEYSHNNKDFKTAKTFELAGHGPPSDRVLKCNAGGWQDFDFVPVRARYWRLYMFNNQGHGTYLAILEVRFMGYE